MIYLIGGENQYEASHKLKQLICGLKQKPQFIYLDEKDTGLRLNDLAIKSQSVGLFFDDTASSFVLKGFESIKKEDFDKLLNILTNANSSTNIIIYSAKKLKKSLKIYKFCLKYGKVFDFEQLKRSDLINWALKYCKDNNCKIKNELLNRLVFEVENDQSLLKNELDKLILLYKAQGEISNDEFEEITIKKTFDIWQFLDNILKSKKNALKILDEILLTQDVEQIIAMLVRELRLITLALSVKTQNDLMRFGVHPFVAQKTIKIARSFSFRKIQVLYSKLLDLEISIRSGKIDKRIGLDLLVIIF